MDLEFIDEPDINANRSFIENTVVTTTETRRQQNLEIIDEEEDSALS